jgi:restriction endonuclease
MKKESKEAKETMMQSSTAQYLTFVSASGDDPSSVEVRYEDENIWMMQKMMCANRHHDGNGNGKTYTYAKTMFELNKMYH